MLKTIASNTSIDGGGLITISGGNSVRVFSVSTGKNFSVQNLSISNGHVTSGAGAIDTGSTGGGTLTVTNCTFSGNSTCISGSNETVVITHSTFSNNSTLGTGANGGAIKGGNGRSTTARARRDGTEQSRRSRRSSLADLVTAFVDNTNGRIYCAGTTPLP